MTATKGAFPESRRQTYLRGLADEALAAEDATKAILSAHEAEAEATAKRRLKLGTMAVKHRADRLVAVTHAEKHVKAFVGAVKDIIALAGDERAALVELNEPCDTLTKPSIMRRLARYWSHEIRQMESPTAVRWGEVTLASYFRSAVDWTTAEKRATAALPGREGNGAVDD